MSALVCQGCGAELLPRKQKWCSERCRRHTSYGGRCVDCGASTYSGGTTPPERCVRCTARTRTIWTREALVTTIQAWAREHGGIPPVVTDWNPQHAIAKGHPEKAEAFYEDFVWPHVDAVQDEFGSWRAGLEAAGFTPFRSGCYGRDGEDVELCREIAERYAAGGSTIALAREYDCGPQAIRNRVRAAGGILRPSGPTYGRRAA